MKKILLIIALLTFCVTAFAAPPPTPNYWIYDPVNQIMYPAIPGTGIGSLPAGGGSPLACNYNGTTGLYECDMGFSFGGTGAARVGFTNGSTDPSASDEYNIYFKGGYPCIKSASKVVPLMIPHSLNTTLVSQLGIEGTVWNPITNIFDFDLSANEYVFTPTATNPVHTALQSVETNDFMTLIAYSGTNNQYLASGASLDYLNSVLTESISTGETASNLGVYKTGGFLKTTDNTNDGNNNIYTYGYTLPVASGVTSLEVIGKFDMSDCAWTSGTQYAFIMINYGAFSSSSGFMAALGYYKTAAAGDADELSYLDYSNRASISYPKITGEMLADAHTYRMVLTYVSATATDLKIYLDAGTTPVVDLDIDTTDMGGLDTLQLSVAARTRKGASADGTADIEDYGFTVKWGM